MKNIYLVSLLLLTAAGTAAAQSPAVDVQPLVAQASGRFKAKEGTFQLIQTGKFKEAIQDEVLFLIEARRDETKVTYYELSPNTVVMILPYEEIRKPDFKPLPLYKD